MRAWLTAMFVSLPAAAQAMCAHGSFHGEGGLLAGALFGLVAALGYWVLLQAVKESSTCIKRIGDVLGSVLVLVGLLGLLCAVTNHVRNSMGKCCGGAGAGMPASCPPREMGQLPPGHPPVSEAPAQKKAAKPK